MKLFFRRKTHAFEINLLIILVIIGQIAFAAVSTDFTKPHWENRIYATTGVKHDSSDLHKLNEAAHYFGQTMIGWTKFPHFADELISAASLPEQSSINAHIQERQNIIFTVYTPELIDAGKIIEVKNYIQARMDDYNEVNQTKFVLSNLDYEQVKVKKSYGFGATTALVLSLVVGVGIIFIRKEFFN
jgi:capsular polysaccharide biosynthesis protein